MHFSPSSGRVTTPPTGELRYQVRWERWRWRVGTQPSYLSRSDWREGRRPLLPDRHGPPLATSTPPPSRPVLPHCKVARVLGVCIVQEWLQCFDSPVSADADASGRVSSTWEPPAGEHPGRGRRSTRSDLGAAAACLGLRSRSHRATMPSPAMGACCMHVCPLSPAVSQFALCAPNKSLYRRLRAAPGVRATLRSRSADVFLVCMLVCM
jgi:hypothetical protein